MNPTQRSFMLLAISAVAALLQITESAVTSSHKVAKQSLLYAIPLDPNTGQYVLNLEKGKTIASSINGLKDAEVALDPTSLFAVTGVSLRFSKVDYTVATGIYSNWGNAKKYTSPDPVAFAYTKTGVKAEYLQLETVVNGSFTFNVQGDTIIPSQLAQDFTYSEGNLTAGSVNPAFNANEMKGYNGISPMVVFSGGTDNTLVFTLASGQRDNIDGSISSLAVASSTRNILWVAIEGFSFKPGATNKKNVC